MSGVTGFNSFMYVALALFGLLFGSFANVLIWRIPRGESIVTPGSHCPSCDRPIRWHDNIPIVSWAVLGGRCRDCGAPISWRYPAVEAASATLWALAYWRFGFDPKLPLAIVFFYMLLVLSVIDIDTRRLPTPAVAVIACAGLVAAIASTVTGVPFGPLTEASASAAQWLQNPALYSALGFLLGGGTSVAIAMVYSLIRKADGLGFGDVRLLGAMGLVLGPLVLLAYALANILGVFFAVPVLIRARRLRRLYAPVGFEGELPATPDSTEFWDRDADFSTPTTDDLPLATDCGADSGAEVDAIASETKPASIQFGPFLGVSGIVVALWGPTLWGAYLRMLRFG